LKTEHIVPHFIDVEQEDGNIIPETWRNIYSSGGIECIRSTTAHRSTTEAYKQRDAIAEYLMTSAGFMAKRLYL